MEDRKIAVVMPVTQLELASRLLIDLNSGVPWPKLVIVIDDSEKSYSPPEIRSKVELIRSDRKNWIGINGFWNLGVSLVPDDFEFVTIINDDMTINGFFLRMVVVAFDKHPNAGVVCPQLAQKIEHVSGDPNTVKCSLMARREGGAFTFRKSILNRIPPIPKQLKVSFGDDWYFHWTHKLGHTWIKVENNLIFHHGSLGNKQRGNRRFLRPEREEYYRLIGTV